MEHDSTLRAATRVWVGIWVVLYGFVRQIMWVDDVQIYHSFHFLR
jgi:hypothetical protein